MTREERTKLIRHLKYNRSIGADYLITDKDADEIIKALEQESKTGHWVKYGSQRCGEQHYQCTSCGYYINFGQWGEVYTKEFKYCPYCGAKMVAIEKRG